ncbi:MAG TPA: PAAR-like domain-containing protein [Polyangiaceae bacterium]|nr:PAAR-like domain-containing protein [Polyangiaceae bacterium]
MPLISAYKMVASITSGHQLISSGPNDICKTPAPPAPAPIPLPYPNIAMTVTPGPGYTTKTLVMGTPMYTKKSKTAISNGDQPGIAMGLISNKIMGMCQVVMSSMDVKAEGGGVVRTFDNTLSNG